MRFGAVAQYVYASGETTPRLHAPVATSPVVALAEVVPTFHEPTSMIGDVSHVVVWTTGLAIECVEGLPSFSDSPKRTVHARAHSDHSTNRCRIIIRRD